MTTESVEETPYALYRRLRAEQLPRAVIVERLMQRGLEAEDVKLLMVDDELSQRTAGSYEAPALRGSHPLTMGFFEAMATDANAPESEDDVDPAVFAEGTARLKGPARRTAALVALAGVFAPLGLAFVIDWQPSVAVQYCAVAVAPILLLAAIQAFTNDPWPGLLAAFLIGFCALVSIKVTAKMFTLGGLTATLFLVAGAALAGGASRALVAERARVRAQLLAVGLTRAPQASSSS